MKYSREQLSAISTSTGFRAEILEKVLLLLDLLETFYFDPILKDKMVLKGGTALNLFYLNLPRLSVDIDLNYIGTIDRAMMLVDRVRIEERIVALCARQGFFIHRQPTNHAGGKLVWRYPSALDHVGSLEIDLNFMYRLALLPVEKMDSCKVGEHQISNISVLNINELAAGKMCALIDRTLGRDLFDAYQLLNSGLLDLKTLRLIFIVYAGMNRKKDIRKIKAEQITYDLKELNDRLFPMLSLRYLKNIDSQGSWVTDMVAIVQEFLQELFPLKENEISFLNALLDFGEIKPSFLTNDALMQSKIIIHPALKWCAYNVQKRN